MRLFLDCYPCMLKLVLKISELMDFSDHQTKNLLNKTMDFLSELKPADSLTPPQIAAEVFEWAEKINGKEGEEFDPYEELKKYSNDTAMSLYESLTEIISEYPHQNKLEAAVRVAAAGNIIDFGAKDHDSIDISEEVRMIPDLTFGIFDISALRTRLKNASKLLYIGDNAGEIVFDKVFIEYLRDNYPELEIIFVVRDKPILNDITLQDARDTGMDKLVKVISSGSEYPGTVIEKTSSQFRQYFDSADIVIAKGQGNYETLSENIVENLFFIFRVKCLQVSNDIGAEEGLLILYNNVAK